MNYMIIEKITPILRWFSAYVIGARAMRIQYMIDASITLAISIIRLDRLISMPFDSIRLDDAPSAIAENHLEVISSSVQNSICFFYTHTLS